MKRTLMIIVSIGILLFIGFSIFAHHRIQKTANEQPPDNVPYIIVLGAKVDGKVMSLSLLYRAQQALQYLRTNPLSKVISTGGQGSGEDITEAEAVKRYLLENGISEERILLEDRSTSTFENLSYAKKLYNVEEAVIVSSDFHLYRAIKNAESVGMKAYPLAAKTPNVVKWKLYVREYMAILKLVVIGK